MKTVSKQQEPLARGLRRAVGSDRVHTDAETLSAHSGDKWFAANLPEVVVQATTTEEVSATLRYASRHRIPVTARGAGYGYVGGAVPSRGGIALGLMGMNRILEINAEDGVVITQPGVITGVLQEAVKAKGLFYPPDPASLKNSSIGGNIATNAGGPRCLKYGVTKNYVLGLQVVLPSGEIVEPGGRVHKNKTGFDLCSLFVGSEGLLGILTRATLKLLPLPPARAAVSCGFATIEAAAAAVQGILQSGFLPCAMEIADALTLRSAREHMGKGLVPDGKAHLLVELDGHPESVRSELASLTKLIKKMGALTPRTANGEAECEKLWALRRGFSESLKATGLKKLNEDVVVPRGRLVDLVQFSAQLEKQFGFPIACFGHAGDGNIHVNVMLADPENPTVRKQSEKVLDLLFRQVLAWDGAITGEHGVGLAKKRWWKDAASPAVRRLHATVKNALDPAGILNPGKFL